VKSSGKPSPYHRLSPGKIADFRRKVYCNYSEYGRDLPWRRTHDPYRILVSEIMLQQTQVERVIEKYERFVTAFPDFRALARARFRDVLLEWQGLGYNRRALALQHIAQRVVAEFGGQLPDSQDDLRAFSGIGPATAGALTAFAFNRPVVFIETNIRRVFIHFFFARKAGVHDREILPLVEQTLDSGRVREWYYALMDYGAMLNKLEQNPNRRSAHYHRQAAFHNSDRQIRGLILKLLLESPDLSERDLVGAVGKGALRVGAIIGDLVYEGLLERRGERLSIASSEIAAEAQAGVPSIKYFPREHSNSRR